MLTSFLNSFFLEGTIFLNSIMWSDSVFSIRKETKKSCGPRKRARWANSVSISIKQGPKRIDSYQIGTSSPVKAPCD